MQILIVEDDVRLGRVLERVFVEEGHAVEICATTCGARERVRCTRFDQIVLDWMLPDGDGVQLCAELRELGLTVPILMLTAKGEVHERVLGLKSGADDYLLKPFDVEELLARVSALQRRTLDVRLQVGALVLDRVSRTAFASGERLDLAAREFDVLLDLAQAGGAVRTRQELLASVWRLHRDPGTNVLEVQVSRLRDKLGERAWMLQTVRGAGYRLRAEKSSD